MAAVRGTMGPPRDSNQSSGITVGLRWETETIVPLRETTTLVGERREEGGECEELKNRRPFIDSLGWKLRISLLSLCPLLFELFF